MLWPFSPLCRFETALVGFGKFQTPFDAGQELLADEPTRVPEQEKQPPYLNTADWLRPQSGHRCRAEPCPLLGVKRTLIGHAAIFTNK
jgi:hypothetical protein